MTIAKPLSLALKARDTENTIVLREDYELGGLRCPEESNSSVVFKDSRLEAAIVSLDRKEQVGGYTLKVGAGVKVVRELREDDCGFLIPSLHGGAQGGAEYSVERRAPHR